MLKAMLFVDAGWLHASLSDQDHDEAALDPRRLASALIGELGRQSELGRIDLIRSHWYVGLPESHDPGDEEPARRLRALVGRLKAVPGLEVQAWAGDQGSGRLDPTAAVERPGEATIAVALSVDLLRYAAQPASLDLAIVVAGGAAYVPLLQEVRRLGKRVVVAAVEGASAPQLVEPRDPAGVRDFEVIWLEPLLGRLDRPRGRGRPPVGDTPSGPAELPAGQDLTGRIKNIIWDRGYGFIAAEDGRDYFFHANALEGELEFDGLQPDLAVSFEVKSGPIGGRAGAARRVWRDAQAHATPLLPGDGPQPGDGELPVEADEDDDEPPQLQGSPPE